MTREQRQEIERKLVRKLVRILKEHGWNAVKVDDGGEDLVYTRTEQDVMDTVFSVDEATVYFKKDKSVHGVRVILGNSGWDAISDWAYSEGDPDGFNVIMDGEVMDYADKLDRESA